MSRSYGIPAYEATKRTPRHGWLISGGYTDGLALPPELPELVVKAIACYVQAEVEAAVTEARS